MFFYGAVGDAVLPDGNFTPFMVEHEHLSFPLVTVPLYMAAVGTGRLRPRKTIWTEPLMWIGFAISFLHFLSIMLHATNPSFPTLGTHYDVGKLFTEKPLDALRPLFFVCL